MTFWIFVLGICAAAAILGRSRQIHPIVITIQPEEAPTGLGCGPFILAALALWFVLSLVNQ